MSDKELATSGQVNSSSNAEQLKKIIDNNMFVDDVEFVEATQYDKASRTVSPVLFPRIPAEAIEVQADVASMLPISINDEDNVSLISAASSVCSILHKKDKVGKKKRKIADDVGFEFDDDPPFQASHDIEDIIDIKALGARIVSNSNKIDEMRQKSGKLQGKISGDMKKMLKQIKAAAYSLMSRVTCDSPAGNVRKTCARVAVENEKLTNEVAKLRAQVDKSPSFDEAARKVPVIRSVVPVSEDDRMYIKPSTSKTNGDNFLKPLPKRVSENISVNKDLTALDEERIVERVTTNVVKAIQGMLNSNEVRKSQKPRKSNDDRPFSTGNTYRNALSSRDSSVSRHSESREKSPSVRFYNGQEYQSSDEEFSPLPTPKNQWKDVQKTKGVQQKMNLKNKKKEVNKNTQVSQRMANYNEGNEAQRSRPAVRQQGKDNARVSSRSRSRSTSASRRDRIDKRRPPRAAVVAIGKTDETLSYADIMRKARTNISLTQLGINKSKVRFAKTGDVLVEVYGDNKRRKADQLANKLSSLMEGIRVRRPEKQGTLRIYGFHNSVNEGDIKDCICREADCPRTDLKIGARIRNRNGLYSTTVRCPLGTAINLSKLRRIRLGWSYVSLVLLRARALRCFRCFELGHVNTKCTSPNDRSGICFRCSMFGHKAFECSADYFCIVCAEKRLNSDHAIGSARCGVNGDNAGVDLCEFPHNSVANFVPNRSNDGTGMSN